MHYCFFLHFSSYQVVYSTDTHIQRTGGEREKPQFFFGITSTRPRTFRHLIAFLSLRFAFNYQPISRRDQYPKFKFINLIFQLKQLSFLNIVALETASKNVTIAVHGISKERNTKDIQNFIPLNYCEEPIFHELLYLLIY